MQAGDKEERPGLSPAEVEARRERYGANVLTPPPRIPLWKLYVEKYDDPIIKVLLVSAAVSLALSFVEGEFAETIGIFLAIFLATTIGFYFERDAARRFNVLTAVSEETLVKVVRGGKVCETARKDVVVGDVVIIETGDEIPADGLLFEAVNLQVDESSLTGEPVAEKGVGRRDGDAAAYPHDFVLRSTMVMNGTGKMTVTAVGDATEIGHVARESTELTSVKTPLNIQLGRLAKMISKVGTVIAVAAFALFLARDIIVDPVWGTGDYLSMLRTVLRYFMVAVTLIVMTVPEGLPMAVTLSLALNMRRMLKNNNLVRKLHACETMGAVTVICTDKTGTLTQNKMQVSEMYELTEGEAAEHFLHCNIAVNATASLDDGKGIGNPTECALLAWLAGKGVDYKSIRDAVTVAGRKPFSTEWKYMATLCDVAGMRVLLVKGAPEIVLRCCTLDSRGKKRAADALKDYQRRGMRTIAFAYAGTSDMTAEGLTPLAIAAISDPLRDDVPAAVRSCKAAGIDIKVVTGDTPLTALEIARQAGIVEGDGDTLLEEGKATVSGQEYAALSDEEAYGRARRIRVMSRARPADKLRLVTMLQRHGEVVAVTGDGTNDAPALHHAHVGLSLGSGTSVAKNASDITLLDDSFGSIVMAVKWGRSLYRNIQRFVFFQLIVNVTALLLVLGGAVIGTTLPLTIPQILWINLIMDTFAAMALSSLPPEDDVMREKPRSPDAFIITKAMGKAIVTTGVLFFAVMMALLYYYEKVAGLDPRRLTIFFTVFVMMQWWNLFNARSWQAAGSAFSHILSSRGLLLVLALIIVGQFLIVECGEKMFRTVPLDLYTWIWIFVLTSPVMIVGEVARMWRKHRRTRT